MVEVYHAHLLRVKPSVLSCHVEVVMTKEVMSLNPPRFLDVRQTYLLIECEEVLGRFCQKKLMEKIYECLQRNTHTHITHTHTNTHIYI
jgi:hypothetical protein